ncbi:hypothetical protein [Methyloglobulus sp.]|uniref:ATP-binding protein n=1 Tax=Methyloglobulus sp. TaxID=2518622 RepID=UPI0032B79B46
MGTSNRETNFSSQRSAIPFGKFETGSDDIFPCNESMVGREGARAKLIDFLTNAGTRKAILVTGRRGMGKTSFVNYCLKEYEEARIERYWRSDIGRTLSAWLWLTVISVICAAIFITGSWLLKILLDNAVNKGSYLFWLPIAILVFYLSYPLQHALKMISVLLKIKPDVSVKSLGYFLVFGFVAVFMFIPPDTGSPVITLSRLLVALAATYFAGELFDIEIMRCKNQRLGGIVLPFLGGMIGILTFFFEPIIRLNYPNGSEAVLFFSNLFVASVLMALALVNRSISLFRKPKHIGKLQISSVLKKSGCWFFSLGIVFLSPLLLLVTYSVSIWLNGSDTGDKLEIYGESEWSLLLIVSVLYTIIVGIFSRKREDQNKDTGYRKRHLYSTAILSLKAGFFILLSLYALHPLLALTNLPSESYCQWQSSSTSVSYFPRPFCSVIDPPLERHNPKDNIFLSNYRPQLLNAKHELAYIALIVVITAFIFWIEYEWVIRPGQKWGRDKSMNVSQRPGYYDDFDPGEHEFVKITSTGEQARKDARNEVQRYMLHQANIRERHRDLDALTFLGYFKHLHLTTLVSTINLGFEELDHRSVIHAMLLDIRGQYYEKFVSLRSPRVLVRYCFGLLLAMMLVNYLSAHFFKPEQQASTKANTVLDSSKQSETAGEKIDDQKRILLETKFCYKTYKQGRSSDSNGGRQVNSDEIYDNLPKVPRLLCELGGVYAEKILPFIYFELIPIHLEKNDVPNAEVLDVLFDTRPSYLDACYNSGEGCAKKGKCTFMSIISYCLSWFFICLDG